jgi:hypothetical protein
MKQFSFKISGNTYKVDIHSIDGNELSLSVNGEDYLVSLEGEQRKTPTITIPKTSVSQVPAENTHRTHRRKRVGPDRRASSRGGPQDKRQGRGSGEKRGSRMHPGSHEDAE